MMAAIELDEHAGMRHPVTPRVVTGWSPGPRAAQAGTEQNPAHRGTGDGERFACSEQFGEVHMVRPGVGGFGQGLDARADRVRDAPGRRAAAIAMDQRSRATAAVSGPEPADVSHGHAQQARRVSHLEFSWLQGVEDEQPVLCQWCQGDRSHNARQVRPGGGRTFSLTS